MYAVFVIGRTGDTELRSYLNRGAFLDALGLPKTTETWWAVARLYGSVLEIESRADADEVLQIIRHRYPVHLAKAEGQIRAWLNGLSACASEGPLNSKNLLGRVLFAASRAS
jgi:hypothetical protein